MTKTNPRMILFDYGQTLLHEASFDRRAALEALTPHLYPKENIDIDKILEFTDDLYEDLRELAFANSVEVGFDVTLNYTLDMFGLSCDLPMLECEKLYWFSACPGEPMPYLQETLNELKERGIRTAVVSNISFSSEAVKARIDSHLKHDFEFVVASSETILRKPEKWIFLSAFKQAGLEPEDCWYVGDNIYCDLHGAFRLGMHPVFYDSGHECFYPREEAEITEEMRPKVDIIEHYTELLDLLEA